MALACLAGLRHVQHRLHLVGQHNRVRQAQHRRAVHNDVLRSLGLQQVHQFHQARTGQQVHRAGRNGPGRDHAQVGNARVLGQRAFLVVARQVVGQPVRIVQFQKLVRRRVAHVAIYQHHLVAHLRKVDGQRQRCGGLALVLRGAGQHQAARRALRGRKLQRRAHRAVGLGNLPARVLVGQQRQAGQVGLFLHLRNHAQQRHHQQLFHLIGKLDGIVQRLQQKHQPQAQHQACQQANGCVQRNARLVRKQRHLGLVHHLDVVGFHAAGHAHFLHLLQQAVVQLAVGVHLALEQVEVHAAVLALHDFLARLLQPAANLPLLAFGGGQLVAHRRQNVLHLGIDLPVQVVHLRAQLLHLRKICLVHLGVLLVLLVQLADLRLVVLDALALQHLARRTGRHANRFVLRLGLDQLLLGLGHGR